jgi:hypothetical protein
VVRAGAAVQNDNRGTAADAALEDPHATNIATARLGWGSNRS